MARSGEVKETLAEVTGISRSVIEHLDRGIGKLDLLPRQPGRYAPHYTATDVAHMLVGLMIISDGLAHSAVGIVREFPELKKFTKRVGAAFKYRNGNLETRHSIPPEMSGSFIEAVAKELERRCQNPDASRDCVIGLTFAGDAICGWIDQQPINGNPAERTRHSYGDVKPIEAIGFKREARVELPALLEIAALLKPPAGEGA